MTYKFIVMDMDDTLLTSNNQISEGTHAYLMEKQRQGMRIILASGRPTAGMMMHAESLKLKDYGGFIVSYNGAIAIDTKNGKEILKQTIRKKDAHEIIDYCRSQQFFSLTYINDEIIYDSDHEYMNIESELTGLPMKKVQDIKEAITDEVPKLMGVDYEKNISKAQSSLEGAFNESVATTISKPYFLEFMNVNVSKGKTLKTLFNQINVDASEVIAFGDSFNDLDMLQYAGIGVAMGNANETIRNIADIVTDDHDSDGIPKALDKILNK